MKDPTTEAIADNAARFRELKAELDELKRQKPDLNNPQPIPMLLWCPECGERHVDEGEFATKPHHTHACQKCGHVWRPAIGPTCGVRFLTGFKDKDDGAQSDVDELVARSLGDGLTKTRVIKAKTPSTSTSHNPVFSNVWDVNGGILLIGCSCGFRCATTVPDDEIALHLAAIHSLEPKSPSMIAYNAVIERFGDGGSPDERRAFYWTILRKEEDKREGPDNLALRNIIMKTAAASKSTAAHDEIRSRLDKKMAAVAAAKIRIADGALGQLYLTVSKPWGSEKIWARTDKYVGKILTIQSGQSLSLQYHREKSETIMVLTGGVLFTYGDVDGGLKSRTVGPNEPIDIPPGLIHRMHAIEPTTVIEVSTPELDDVVRLEDRYGRVGPDRHDT